MKHGLLALLGFVLGMAGFGGLYVAMFKVTPLIGADWSRAYVLTDFRDALMIAVVSAFALWAGLKIMWRETPKVPTLPKHFFYRVVFFGLAGATAYKLYYAQSLSEQVLYALGTLFAAFATFWVPKRDKELDVQEEKHKVSNVFK